MLKLIKKVFIQIEQIQREMQYYEYRSEDIKLIKKIIVKTSLVEIDKILIAQFEGILKDVLAQDYLEKESLIDMFNLFQKQHQKKPTETIEDIVIELRVELEEINGQILRLKEILKKISL